MLANLKKRFVHPMPSSFWSTQPAKRGDSAVPIAEENPPSPERTTLPLGLTWIQPDSPSEIAAFLHQNYVEDPDSEFRFSYSEGFFRYLFSAPSHDPKLSLGVADSDGMVGYVLGKRHHLTAGSKTKEVISVNFLCLSRSYRRLGIAPLMISEITRIANSFGIFQGVFTGQRDRGFAIASTVYYHLILDSLKLKESGFIRDNCFEHKKRPIRSGSVIADKANAAVILKFMDSELGHYKLYEKLTEEEVAHVFFSGHRDGVHTIMNLDKSEFASIFFIDTYSIDKSISFKVAYLYYWAGSVEIVSDAIEYAREAGASLFNILDLGRNKEAIGKFGFVEGTGVLDYHLFNWRENPIYKKELNFILF